MPELKVIADYGDLCGEGPLWDFRSNQLYWTDITSIIEKISTPTGGRARAGCGRRFLHT